MIIYAGKRMTATIGGERIEAVVCEKCATAFFYAFSRVGVGNASAPYFIGQGRATHRAAASAERDLGRQLERDAETVPCPTCHWINADLVARHRRYRYRRLNGYIAAVIGCAVVISPFLGMTLSEFYPAPSAVPKIAAGALVGLAVVVAVVMVFIRSRWRGAIDPNRTHPRPTLPPGTPPALLHHVDPITGIESFRPAAVTGVDEKSSEHWAFLRRGRVALPDVCCVCLGTASATFALPFNAHARDRMPLPVCAACQRAGVWRWWQTAAAIACVSAVISGLITHAFDGVDTFQRWFLFGIFTLIGTLIGGAIFGPRRASPYQIADVDTARGVFKFAARNPAYTRLVAEASSKTDIIVIDDLEAEETSSILQYARVDVNRP